MANACLPGSSQRSCRQTLAGMAEPFHDARAMRAKAVGRVQAIRTSLVLDGGVVRLSSVICEAYEREDAFDAPEPELLVCSRARSEREKGRGAKAAFTLLFLLESRAVVGN